MADRKTVFVNLKVPKPLLTWLKIEAARAGVPMYVLVERRFPEVKRKG